MGFSSADMIVKLHEDPLYHHHHCLLILPFSHNLTCFFFVLATICASASGRDEEKQPFLSIDGRCGATHGPLPAARCQRPSARQGCQPRRGVFFITGVFSPWKCGEAELPEKRTSRSRLAADLRGRRKGQQPRTIKRLSSGALCRELRESSAYGVSAPNLIFLTTIYFKCKHFGEPHQI